MKYSSTARKSLLRLILSSLFAASLLFESKANTFYADSTIEGRWDITIDMGGKPAPSWLEIRHSGLHTLIGEFVGVSGSSRPISKVNFTSGKMSFSIPPQWEEGNDVSVEGTLENNGLKGTILFPDGKTYNWTGVRAPRLRRSSTPAWGNEIRLFNGKDLTGWRALGQNQWQAENGVLKSPNLALTLLASKNLLTSNFI